MDGATNGSWWREGVFYQIYPRSFQDSNGDGVGDLAGVVSRLDHLERLGVDAIWLSPHYPSPMKDFGYDVSDYRGVDPSFGTLEDFDRLLAEAHARGIRLIVDLVPNHTSSEHPWFVEARSSRDNPKRDWYVWSDSRPGGRPPNNWRSAFPRVGPAWTRDAASGQHYLHHFMPEQPDLNWWNPKVRDAFDEILRFWLDRGVDGFRIDVAHGILSDARLRPNSPAKRYDIDLPEVHDIHRRWRKVLDSYEDRMAVGEVYLLDVRRMVRYYGAGDELHLAFNFWFLRQPWRAEAFRAAVEQFERLLPPGAWPNYTLSNHDHSRTASRYDETGHGDERARVAAMMLLTLRGTPFLYQGEEIGMRDTRLPKKFQFDVNDRDKVRTPMPWDGSDQGGFTTGEPWLPLGRDARTRNVARQVAHSRSTLSLYRKLIALRRKSSALRRGRYRSVRAPDGIFAYARESEDERWLVALNFRSRPRTVDLSRVSREGALALSTGLDRERGIVDLRSLRLDADEGVLLRIR